MPPVFHASDLQSSLRPIRLWTALFMLGLVLSGLTAIPIVTTFRLAAEYLGSDFRGGGTVPAFAATWLQRVNQGVILAEHDAPYLYYGTDWLAFGHVAIAVAFIGAYRDPIRNRWLYTFGMIACIMLVPWALWFGYVRGIPIWWRIIDCSFGAFGFLPLWFCHQRTGQLERSKS